MRDEPASDPSATADGGRRRLRLAPVAVFVLAVAAAPLTMPGSVSVDPPPVLVGAGDVARCGVDGDERTAKVVADVLAANANALVMLPGDAVYPDGTVADYEQCYLPSWGDFLDRTRPALGNHDYRADGAGYAATFGTVLDRFGPAAADPDRGWYSYDAGSWHVIVLNSMCDEVGGCGAGSDQLRWLRRDLADNPSVCTAAYWHHPRLSSGRHGSSTTVAPFVDALYDAGADVVVAGHDHDYERFAPVRPGGRVDRRFGVRQFVVGTGGGELRPVGDPLPASRHIIEGRFGVLSLGLDPGGYSWGFVTTDGETHDPGAGTCHGAPDTRRGDLDGDGHADLVVGAPGESVGGHDDAGRVTVLYGGPDGSFARSQVLHQGTVGVPGQVEAGDRFGGAVAVGDVDGDGRDDLVVGSPGESIRDRAGAGMVAVLHGSADGLGARSRGIHQGSAGIPGRNEAGDRFGAAVAVGDVDGDGLRDLAVGSPGEDDGTGAVTVLPGDGTPSLLRQGAGLPGTAEPGDRTGAALAAGNLNRDGVVDLAVGAPGEAVADRPAGGAVLLAAGAVGGALDPVGFVHQGSSGVPGRSRDGDRFGGALAFADLTGGGRPELLVGVPGQDLGGRRNAGRVLVLELGGGGAVRDAVTLHQDRSGVPGSNERGDRFGSALAAFADRIAVGVPGEDLAGRRNVGAVAVLHLGEAGWSGQSWNQDRAGVRGRSQVGDRFGAAVASG